MRCLGRHFRHGVFRESRDGQAGVYTRLAEITDPSQISRFL